MSTSGSYNYTITAQDAIQEAYELAQILGEGETPTTDQFNSAMRTLNIMIKGWQAKGLNIFAVQKTFLFPENEVGTYTLNSTTSSVWSTTYEYGYLTADATIPATSLSIDIVASTGDRIGIPYSDGTYFWTTCLANGGGTLSIADSIPADVSTGQVVYACSASVPWEPMAMIEGYAILNQLTSVSLEQMGRQDYYALPKTTTKGLATKIYFQYTPGTVQVHFWPKPDITQQVFQLNISRRLADMDTSSDDFDFPQEWYLPIVTNLAVSLAIKAGLPQEDYIKLKIEAVQALKDAQDFDIENFVSFNVQPAIRNWRR